MSSPLPWQEKPWQELLQRAATDTLPHAILLTSPRGYGKARLAEALTHSLLCQSADSEGKACGQCTTCHLLAAGTHPDFLQLSPEEEGKTIPVDKVRGLGDFLSLKGQYGERQIVIIDPAEAMNRFSANSLLKTLEEPTAGALILLISSRPSLLLPTIRSRCQQLVLPRPNEEQALAWLSAYLEDDVDKQTLLSLADGAPLEALRLQENGGLQNRAELAQQWLALTQGRGDPLACAASWSELGFSQALQWLAGWTMDLIRLKSGAPAVAIVNGDLLAPLQQLAQQSSLQALFAYLEQIMEYQRWVDGQLNSQLALEDLMISWRKTGLQQRPQAATR